MEKNMDKTEKLKDLTAQIDALTAQYAGDKEKSKELENRLNALVQNNGYSSDIVPQLLAGNMAVLETRSTQKPPGSE